MPSPSVLCCFPFFREPGTGEVSGGLLSNFHLVRALSSFTALTVLSLDRQPPSAPHARAAQYSVVSRPPPPWPRGAAYLRWRPFLRKAFTEALATCARPDVVVATTSTLPVLREARRFGIPGVVLVRAYENFGWRIPGGTLRERWHGARLEAVGGFGSPGSIRDADLVIVNSRFMADQVARVFGAHRIAVLHPCIDLGLTTGAESWPGEVDAAPGRPRVGFVYRAAGKNLEFVAGLARRMPDVDFLVFGPPPPAHAGPPNLLVRGWERDRAVMFASASLWIVPSRWREPFGRVAAEARALGRPVLVSDRGGLREAADPGSVVPSLDPGAWVTAIRESLMRPPSGEERARVSRDVAARFGPEAHDRQARAIFSRLFPATS